MPVHSSAMSTPRSFHGSVEGSFTAVTLMGAVAERDGVALDRDFTGEAAVHGIVAQQVGVGLDRAEVVDADDFDILAAAFGDGAQDVAADAAEPVNGNTNGHYFRSRSLLSAFFQQRHAKTVAGCLLDCPRARGKNTRDIVSFPSLPNAASATASAVIPEFLVEFLVRRAGAERVHADKRAIDANDRRPSLGGYRPQRRS